MRGHRLALLVLSLLSGCAANDFGMDDAPGRSTFRPTGAYGAYLAGRYAASQSDLETAADKLEVAAKDSGVREVAGQAFIAAVLADRSEAAQLAASLPDNPVAQLVLADQDAKAGRWDDAEARFAGLPQQGITQLLRPLLMAWAEAGAGRTAQALQTLQPFIEGGRTRGVMALHAALIADLGRDPEAAGRLYGLAVGEYGGTNLRLGTILASWYARQGDIAAMQRVVGEMTGAGGSLAIARLPLEANASAPAVRDAEDGIAEAYLALAASVPPGENDETAQVLLRLSLSMRRNFTASRLLLSEVLERSGRIEAAQDVLDPVRTSDPLAGVVRLREAALKDKAGDTDGAVRMLETMARAYPDRPEPLAEAAGLLRQKNRWRDAVALFDRAIARVGTPSRTNWPLFYERGVAHERAGDWPAAEADFQYALRLSPDQASVLNYLGYAWTERNEHLPEARRMLERAAELRPQDGAVIDSLGWVQLRMGDSGGALKTLERAVELQPEDPVVNGHLGDALAAVGRWREAEFQWRRALNLKPDADEAQRINARLSGAPRLP